MRVCCCRSRPFALALLLAVTVAGSGWPTTRCAAQSTPDDATRATARQLGEQGIEAYWAGDYVTADDKLDKAYRLFAVPTLGLWSARARARLGHLVEAAERYRDTARASDTIGNGAAQKQAQRTAAEELSALLPRIPSLTIQVGDAPHDAVTISIDGVIVPSAMIGIRRPTNPGAHKVEAVLGVEHQMLDVLLIEGEHAEKSFQSSKLTAAAAAASTEPRPSQTARVEREANAGLQAGMTSGNKTDQPLYPPSLADTYPAGYREVVDEALREYEAGNFKEAKSLFLRAHALFPDARTHRGIGKAEFELRNYPECIEQLEAALSSNVRPLEAEVRADTEKLLVRARGFVTTLIIDAKPAASEVLVDGIPAVIGPGKGLVVNAGTRLIEVRAKGYAPERRRMSAKGGKTEMVTLIFGTPLATPHSSEKTPHWYKRPWVWTAVGVAIAAAATGTAVALSRNSGTSTTYDRGSWNSLGTAP
ncbi:MAG: hypothetical protein JWN04_5226 [Myxococcaceae bacterium]|nr:hypothetical protein [Myxococcaceae bacterium]